MDHIELMRAVSARTAAAQLNVQREDYKAASRIFESIANMLDEAHAKRIETEAKGTYK